MVTARNFMDMTMLLYCRPVQGRLALREFHDDNSTSDWIACPRPRRDARGVRPAGRTATCAAGRASAAARVAAAAAAGTRVAVREPRGGGRDPRGGQSPCRVHG